jgi:hypothetical protein
VNLELDFLIWNFINMATNTTTTNKWWSGGSPSTWNMETDDVVFPDE